MSAAPHASTEMVRVDGKFFSVRRAQVPRQGRQLRPVRAGLPSEGFASPDQTRRDFGQIQALGANVVRTYHVPPAWFLDLAVEFQLRVFLDIPWPKHLCFLASAELQAEARRRVREAALACRDHQASSP